GWRAVWAAGGGTVAGSDGDTPSTLRRLAHRTIEGVTEDFGRFRYNTAVAKLMTLTTELQRALDERGPSVAGDARFVAESLVLMLAPMAPHVTEELWRSALGHGSSVHRAAWPAFDPELARPEEVVLVVQVDGK